MAKETHTCGKSDCGKRDLHKWQKRPTQVAKETYTSGKRDLDKWQKRPTLVAKVTYTCGKKRPTLVSKETYTSVKRDLKLKDCGGTSICEHNRQRGQWKECGGLHLWAQPSEEWLRSETHSLSVSCNKHSHAHCDARRGAALPAIPRFPSTVVNQ